MLTVTTDVIAPRERLAFWSDVVCAHAVQADCEPSRGAKPFEGQIDHWCLTDDAPHQPWHGSVSRIRSQAQRVRRTACHVAAAAQEQVLVTIQRSGVSVVQQHHREAVLHPGDLAVFTSDRPYALSFDGAFEQTVLILPAEDVRTWVPDIGEHVAQRVCAHTPVANLLREVAQQVVQGSVAPSAHRHLGHALTSLLAATLASRVGRPSTPLPHGAPQPVERSGPGEETPSARETEVLHSVARGMTYEEIARQMGVSINTVRTHVRSLYAKLGTHNKTEAVFEARLCGWID
jgi:DNA-binding CsgD family transcriptional regulator